MTKRLLKFFPSGNVPTPESMKKRNALADECSQKHSEYLELKAKVAELEKARKTIENYLRHERSASRKRNQQIE